MPHNTENTSGKDYNPEDLVLMLSNQCTGECDHCIVDSKPEKGPLLDKNIIAHSIFSATNFGIYDVLIYGWEPFLQYKDLLPYTIEMALNNGMTVQIGTNWFWWHSTEFAKKVFDKHQTLAQQHNKVLYYGISADMYHQKKIPPQSIANLIILFIKGNYPNLRIGLATFDDEVSQQVIREILRICWEHDVILWKWAPDGAAIWKLSESGILYAVPPDMVHKLKSRVSITDPDWSSLSLSVTNNQLDQSKIIGLQNFIVPISAWRYKHTKDIEYHPKWRDTHQDLILAPDGNAYMFPAQISQQVAPVPYRWQAFSELISEVSEAVKSIVA